MLELQRIEDINKKWHDRRVASIDRRLSNQEEYDLHVRKEANNAVHRDETKKAWSSYVVEFKENKELNDQIDLEKRTDAYRLKWEEK